MDVEVTRRGDKVFNLSCLRDGDPPLCDNAWSSTPSEDMTSLGAQRPSPFGRYPSCSFTYASAYVQVYHDRLSPISYGAL